MVSSATASSAFRAKGFYLEQKIFSDAECDALVALANQMPCDSERPYLPLMQPHRLPEGGLFADALRKPELVALVEEFCGGPASGLQTTFYFGAPGTSGWCKHQDNKLIEAGADAFISAWCALTYVTPEMGGIVVYPNSHHEPLLPHVLVDRPLSANQDPNSLYEAILPLGYTPLPLTMLKGSVLFMHGHLVHYSGRNETNFPRHSLLLTYIRKGEHFRAGNTAKREEIDVH